MTDTSAIWAGQECQGHGRCAPSVGFKTLKNEHALQPQWPSWLTRTDISVFSSASFLSVHFLDTSVFLSRFWIHIGQHQVKRCDHNQWWVRFQAWYELMENWGNLAPVNQETYSNPDVPIMQRWGWVILWLQILINKPKKQVRQETQHINITCISLQHWLNWPRGLRSVTCLTNIID